MPKNRKKGLHYFNLNEQNEQNPALTLGFVIHFYRVGKNHLDLIISQKKFMVAKVLLVLLMKFLRIQKNQNPHNVGETFDLHRSYLQMFL